MPQILEIGGCFEILGRALSHPKPRSVGAGWSDIMNLNIIVYFLFIHCQMSHIDSNKSFKPEQFNKVESYIRTKLSMLRVSMKLGLIVQVQQKANKYTHTNPGRFASTTRDQQLRYSYMLSYRDCHMCMRPLLNTIYP